MQESTLTRRCDSCGYRYESGVESCPIDRSELPPENAEVADLGAYRLLERLGDGGMGAVYKAVHRKLGRTVAIKILQKDLTSDRGIINRFFHEARAANTIRHEHVIEVYDFVQSEDGVYFVMEYLKGQDLHDAIHRNNQGRPMDPTRAVSILEQIASALHATHARNIVHRDLKPENVFLAEREDVKEFVKIFDFGIAKLDRPDGRSTVEGAVLGTPEYMSPEQARGLEIDGRSDLYALGCVAYEMLTRHQLFGGGTQPDILIKQITMTPPPLRKFEPSVPEALEQVVLQALAKNPAQRPQTALAFAESLARAMGRRLEDAAAFQVFSTRTPVKLTTPREGLVLRDGKRRSVWKPVAVGAVLATAATAFLLTGRVAEKEPLRTAAVAQAQPGQAQSTVTVILQSSPSGAIIVDQNGKTVGVTPQSLILRADTEHQVRFQKPGFRTVEHRFRARTDTTIAVSLDSDSASRVSRPARGNVRPPRSPSPATGRLDSVAGTIDPFRE
jgi:serine/threonine-protein kinase